MREAAGFAASVHHLLVRSEQYRQKPEMSFEVKIVLAIFLMYGIIGAETEAGRLSTAA